MPSSFSPPPSQRPGRPVFSDESGLTLTELVVVLAIMGIVMAALAGMLASSVRSSSEIQDRSALQTEARATVDTAIRDLRQAYTGDTTYPIETATSTTLQFLSPDRATPFHLRRIAYRLSGGKISRAQTTSTDTDGAPWVGLGWTTFASIPSTAWASKVGSVTNAAIFSYYDQSGALLTGTITPSSVYRVKITVSVAPKTATARPYTYSSSSSLRWSP